jgi:RNA-binding protein
MPSCARPTALKAHGLIKVRMFSDSRPDREAALASLADRLNAAPVQHIGKLLVLWRPIPDKPKAEVRDDRGAGPRVVKILKFSKSGSQRAQIKKITVFGNQRVTPGGEIKRVQKRVTSVKKKALTEISGGRQPPASQRQDAQQLGTEEADADDVQLAEAQRTLPGPRRGHQRLQREVARHGAEHRAQQQQDLGAEHRSIAAAAAARARLRSMANSATASPMLIQASRWKNQPTTWPATGRSSSANAAGAAMAAMHSSTPAHRPGSRRRRRSSTAGFRCSELRRSRSA